MDVVQKWAWVGLGGHVIATVLLITFCSTPYMLIELKSGGVSPSRYAIEETKLIVEGEKCEYQGGGMQCQVSTDLDFYGQCECVTAEGRRFLSPYQVNDLRSRAWSGDQWRP